MPAEATLLEVGQAVDALRSEVEKKGFIDQDKIARLHLVLDDHEEKSGKITALEQSKITLEQDVKELKELREQHAEAEKISLAAAGEFKGRIDTLEAEIARGINVNLPANFRDTDEYKALNEYCRFGDRMPEEQKQLLRTDSAVDGGVLTTTEMDTVITKKITEFDPVRSVSRVRTTGQKSFDLPIRNTIPTAVFEGEAETGPDSTSAYQLETLTPFRLTFTTPITKDLLMDAAFDMESEVLQDATEAFAFKEGQKFILGTAFKEPGGIFVNATLQTDARISGDATLITADSIIQLTGDLKSGYDPVYMTNRRTLATIRTLVSTDGQFLWLPGLNGPVANTLNGFPYVIGNSIPDIAAQAYVMAFGDFRRGYTIIDRTGMEVVRDEFTLKKRGIIEFTFLRWLTGRVTLTETIKLLKISA